MYCIWIADGKKNFFIWPSFYLFKRKFLQAVNYLHSLRCMQPSVTAGIGVQRVTDYLLQQYKKLSEAF
jgi:hypothetical protein